MISPRELEIRKRLKDDFFYYAPRCLQIVTKEGATVSFNPNPAQVYVHERLEDQIKRTGRVRAIVLKGRQQGMSTYIQARYLWKTTHRKGVKAFILTHVHSATQALYSMTKRYYNNLPDLVKPVIDKNNAAELDFKHLDSGYRVSTAGSKGVGRGSTITYFHGSEVAYWQNGDEHIAGILQAVPESDNTEIILESTANGPSGLFYEMAKKAAAGVGDFELIFVPWFWQPEYTRPLPEDFSMTAEETEYASKYNLTAEQINWRRNKIENFTNGIRDFRREYPATADEAFSAEVVNSLWKWEDINTVLPAEYENIKAQHDILATILAFDPAGTANETSDASGIVVAQLLDNNSVYVLADHSGKYPPNTVLETLAKLYYEYECDRLTVETNYGGDWVTNAIQMHDPNIPVYRVHARKGKRLRAEPVAQAYRQNRVYHVGDLNGLTTEMTTWNPYDPGAASPNRVDAMVYAVTDLLEIGSPAETPVIWSVG